MNMEKLKAVFADEEFAKSLIPMKTLAEVQAALKEKGVDMTEEELIAFRESMVKAENGELSEEMLENVSGGILSLIMMIMEAVDCGW